MPDQISGLLSPFLRRRRFAAARPYLVSGQVLDYGCGVGGLAQEVEPERYLGIERDAESLAIARREHPQHRFLQPEELSRQVGEARFDIVVALALIEHMPDPAAWLVEVRKLLSKDGRVVLTTPHPWFRWAHEVGARVGLFSREGAEEHEELLDRERLAQAGAAAQLRIVEFRRFLGGANQLCVLGRVA